MALIAQAGSAAALTDAAWFELNKDQLEVAVAATALDPLLFVMLVFPWGKPGTQLAEWQGPDANQRGILRELGRRLQQGDLDGAIQIAVSSGHGIGKTTLVAWIILWFMATRPHAQIVVTANTKAQLEGKTWRELAKWWRLSAVKDWFEWTATKFYLKAFPETWAARAVPWTKENSEAFAGTHERHVLIIFDEASAIDDAIWEVAEGAMTTTGAMWLVFGNPTRNTGRFRECFRKFRRQWIKFQIDSRRSAVATNKKKIQQWIESYGEDSDFVRVRVRGVFPRSGTQQLIPEDAIMAAQARNLALPDYEGLAVVIGADVARYGDDQSTIYVRQGRKVLEAKKYRDMSGPALAVQIVITQKRWDADGTFVDSINVGASVVDHLAVLGAEYVGVNCALPAMRNPELYHNWRAEMYGLMKDWFIDSAPDIPGDDPELAEDLGAHEYGYDNKGRVQLEEKDDVKERIGRSPDDSDGLAFTFAMPVIPKATAARRERRKQRERGSWQAG